MATPLAAATSRRVGGLVIGPRRAVGRRADRPDATPSWRRTRPMATIGKRLPGRAHASTVDSHPARADVREGAEQRRRRRRRDGAGMPTDHPDTAPSDLAPAADGSAIRSAEVLITSPDRNFVTLRITTEDGVVGLGDATLNGRELSVASYLSDHVVPLLLGRDAHRIEDTWQFLYRSAYWRRGPVTMAAIAAVDVALWDIKAKVAGLPVYQLLGGASRKGLMAYGHASGKELPELFDSIRAHQEQGYKAIRVQTGVPTLKAIYGIAAQGADVGDATVRYDHEPARRGAKPVEEDWD